MVIILIFSLSSIIAGFGIEDESFEEAGENGNLTGKDFVELGTMGIISGSLKYIDEEWFVQNEDEVYEIHLGDHDYREKNITFELQEDQEVVVCGYIYNSDIAVVLISLKKYTYQCRKVEGTPLWARSSGSGLNQQFQEERLKIENRNLRTEIRQKYLEDKNLEEENKEGENNEENKVNEQD